MNYKIFLFFIIMFSGLNATADESLKLIGKGNYTFFLLDVYEASLWASNKTNIYDGNLNLELKYKMNFEGKDIVKQTQKEFDSAGVPSKFSKKWSNDLEFIFPNVSKGDRILASYKPADGIKFYLNEDNFLGEIKDIEFSRSFLDIWLGPKTSDPDLRDQLLGVKDE